MTNANIEVRKLSPDLSSAWLSFFDRDAFADNPEWAGCYCNFYHADHSETSWDARTAAENRTAARRLISSGRMTGYLAYQGDTVIGWCQAGARASIANVVNDPLLTLPDDDPAEIGSIVCFVVARPYRGIGAARRLLDGACAGFREAGLAVAEAYPRPQAATDAANYHGPLQLYLSSGFSIFRESDDVTVVRRRL